MLVIVIIMLYISYHSHIKGLSVINIRYGYIEFWVSGTYNFYSCEN